MSDRKARIKIEDLPMGEITERTMKGVRGGFSTSNFNIISEPSWGQVGYDAWDPDGGRMSEGDWLKKWNL